MNLYFRLFLIVPFLIFVLPVFSAQNVFVLGSFKSLEAAHKEASRISDELDVDLLVKEVLIDSFIFHRLLVPYSMDPTLERELARELVALGVKDIWRAKTDLNETESFRQSSDLVKDKAQGHVGSAWEAGDLVASENQMYQVVAGSFRQESKAREFVEDLRIWGEELNVVAEDIVGKIFYRVVLGPLRQSDALSTKRKLEDIGVISPWLISYEETVPRPGSVSLQEKAVDALEIDSAPYKRAEEKIEVKAPLKSVPSRFLDAEYNLAKLKKK
jgi:hypothetical protein